MHISHRKIDVVHAFSPSKVARHGIRNNHRLIGQLRLTVVVHRLFHHTDDCEGDPEDLKCPADCRVIAAVAIFRKYFGHIGALHMGRVVSIVEKTA